MSEEKKAVVTPGTTIVAQHFDGSVAELTLPFNHNYCIMEAPALPPELGFPDRFLRVFAVTGVERSSAHAHKKDTEQEIMVCLSGTADFHVWNREGQHRLFILTPPVPGEKYAGVSIDSEIWHTVRYAPNTILLVATTTTYNRDDYIEAVENYFTEEGRKKYEKIFATLN